MGMRRRRVTYTSALISRQCEERRYELAKGT